MTKTEFLKKLSHPDSPFRIEVKCTTEGIFELPRIRPAEDAHEILKTIWDQSLIRFAGTNRCTVSKSCNEVDRLSFDLNRIRRRDSP